MLLYVWQAVFWPLSKTVWILCALSTVLGITVMVLLDRIRFIGRREECECERAAVGPGDVGLYGIIVFTISTFFEIPTVIQTKIKSRLNFSRPLEPDWPNCCNGVQSTPVGILAFPWYPSAPQNFLELANSNYRWSLHHYGGLANDLIRVSLISFLSI